MAPNAVQCLDAKTGEQLWVHEYKCNYKLSYPNGPRATPTVDGKHVYTLGAEGHLNCLEVDSGDVVWSRDLKKDYGMELAPHWGFAAHPLVDGETLYCVVGGEDSVAVAFDKNDGTEKWRALSAKSPGYCPPIDDRSGWDKTADHLASRIAQRLESATGEVYWSFKMKPAYEMSIIAPIKYNDYLFATALQGTSILLKLDTEKPSATKIWEGHGVHPDHNPPLIVDGHIYGSRRTRAFALYRTWNPENEFGKHWRRPPSGVRQTRTTGFLVKNQDHYYLMTEQGELIVAKLSPAGYQELDRAKSSNRLAALGIGTLSGVIPLSLNHACSPATIKKSFVFLWQNRD